MSNLSLTGYEVLMSIIVLTSLFLIILIASRRYWINKKKNHHSRIRNQELKQSFVWRGLSLSMVLALTITLISWTRDDKITYIQPYEVEHVEVVKLIPRTIHKKKTAVPPPPTPESIIVPVEDPEPEPEWVPMDIQAEEPSDGDRESKVAVAPTPPPPILPPENDDDVVDLVVRAERMPRFPTCMLIDATEDEWRSCTETQLLQYIYKHLKYPSAAREIGLEGRVVIRFVVDETGSVGSVEILRDIGAGCGEAAAKVIRTLNKKTGLWIPGRQQGRKVKVQYTLPISYTLKG